MEKLSEYVGEDCEKACISQEQYGGFVAGKTERRK